MCRGESVEGSSWGAQGRGGAVRRWPPPSPSHAVAPLPLSLLLLLPPAALLCRSMSKKHSSSRRRKKVHRPMSKALGRGGLSLPGSPTSSPLLALMLILWLVLLLLLLLLALRAGASTVATHPEALVGAPLLHVPLPPGALQGVAARER